MRGAINARTAVIAALAALGAGPGRGGPGPLTLNTCDFVELQNSRQAATNLSRLHIASTGNPHRHGVSNRRRAAKRRWKARRQRGGR